MNPSTVKASVATQVFSAVVRLIFRRLFRLLFHHPPARAFRNITTSTKLPSGDSVPGRSSVWGPLSLDMEEEEEEEGLPGDKSAPPTGWRWWRGAGWAGEEAWKRGTPPPRSTLISAGRVVLRTPNRSPQRWQDQGPSGSEA